MSAETLPQLIALPAKIVRQPPVRIDTLLTKDEFLLLAQHMTNGNPQSHFLTVWRDDEGKANHTKAKPNNQLDKHASWSWDTIIDKAKRKTGLGFYPKNQENKSTFGALDFDAHSGSDELAKARSIRAFSLLLEYRDHYLILSASGRGYHVFIFARDPKPVAEWVHLLKDTCETIDAPIQDGVCEIFPNERTEKQVVGKAIRMPGTFNPTTDDIELIMAETIRALVDHLEKRSPKSHSVHTKTLSLVNCTEIKKQITSFYTVGGFLTPSTGKLIEGVILKHPINARSTRNGVLVRLAGECFHKFGWQLSERVIREHFERNKGNTTTPLGEHMREFSAAWQSFREKAARSLSQSERRIFEVLNTEPQREGFLIIRSFWALAKSDDFKVGLYSLADRLSLSISGARYVIAKLVELGAITQTAPARVNIESARYRWDCD
jgi:hypothetical protein